MAKKRSIGISLPVDQYDWIKTRAFQNCRSFSRELEYLLEAARGADLNDQIDRLRAYAQIEKIKGE